MFIMMEFSLKKQFGFLLTAVIIFPTIFGFEESSIFEDEDIYRNVVETPNPDSGMTVPGTKWCGPGNTAKNYDDLGKYSATDSCCRAHDHCNEIIPPQKSLNGLHNPDWFPRMKCECEQTFLNCLQAVNDYVAITMGKTYFTARNNCFRLDYPIVECTQYQNGIVRRRCIRYKFDTSKPKKWQFFDIPFYTM